MPTKTVKKSKSLKTVAPKQFSSGKPNVSKVTGPQYQPFGCIKELFYDKSPAIVISGPAGTGKSRGVLEKCHLLLQKYPGSRGLMTRLTRQSMTHTCMKTFNQFVNQDNKMCRFKPSDQAYIYSNGSEFVTLGLDDPTNIMSGEYDFIYIQEATQVPHDTYGQLLTRLNRLNRIPYQQMLLDVNPGDPNHWIMKEVNAKAMQMYFSWHEDNPVFYNHETKTWTPEGILYIQRLDTLSGVLHKRLRLGLWVSAEGAVYPQYEDTVHLIQKPNPLPPGVIIWTIDFGYKDPFVWQEWLDCDNGDLILLREYYHTKKLVSEAAQEIITASKDDKGQLVKPHAIICDHDAEGRAQLEIAWEMMTLPAFKSIRVGIQGVQNRLNKRKIMFCADSLIHSPDAELVFEHKPHKTIDEFSSYIYDKDPKPSKVEIPVDKFNHGMDAMRYGVGYVDSLSLDMSAIDVLVQLEEDMEVRICPV